MNKIININQQEINHISSGVNLEKTNSTVSANKNSDDNNGITIVTVIAVIVPALFVSFCCSLIGVAYALNKDQINNNLHTET